MKQFHVYEDWTIEEEPRCFYVGKGDDDRIARSQRNRHHADVVAMYGFERRILFTTTSEDEALEVERRLIGERHTHPRDTDYNGIGCNRTLGGQGNSGRIVSDETKKRISESKRGKTPNKIWSREERDATSKRMSSVHKGKVISQSMRVHLSIVMNEPERKSAMVEKVTASIRKKYEDPVFRQKIRETRCKGESSGRAIFIEEDVRMMRDEWDASDFSERGSKKRFCERWAVVRNSTLATVFSIVTRKTWRHLP